MRFADLLPPQDEKALLADLAAMLLSNMSKLESVSRQLLALRLSFAVPAEGDSVADGTMEELEALDVLLEVFLKGEGKKYNPNANYDFLASVFANVSTVSSWVRTSRARADLPFAFLQDSDRSRFSSCYSFSRHGASSRQAHLLHRAPLHDPPRWRRLLNQVRRLLLLPPYLSHHTLQEFGL